MTALLKTIDGGGKRPNYVHFVVCGALIFSGWVVLAWSRKSNLQLAKIAS